MLAPRTKFLIIDGISGVPLGQEIADTLSALGHTVRHFDCLKQQARRFYPLHSAIAKTLNRRAQRDGFYFLPRLVETDLGQLINDERPDYILVIGFIYKFFDPKALQNLAAAAGAQLLLYDTDSCNLYSRRREFIFFIETELPIYNRIFSFSKITTRFFRETRGLDAVHLPFGAQPLPPGTEHKTLDVLFVGSCDLRRIFLLEAIREHVSVRGNRWRRNAPLISNALQERVDDRPVWGNELHTLLGRAKIILNITRTDFYGAETGVNLRIFEALAAGGFLLTDHCDEIGELFKVGHELETYRSSEELADKVKYYLSHDAQRNKIAQRGQTVFAEKHTWRARLSQAFLPELTRQQTTHPVQLLG